MNRNQLAQRLYGVSARGTLGKQETGDTDGPSNPWTPSLNKGPKQGIFPIVFCLLAQEYSTNSSTDKLLAPEAAADQYNERLLLSWWEEGKSLNSFLCTPTYFSTFSFLCLTWSPHVKLKFHGLFLAPNSVCVRHLLHQWILNLYFQCLFLHYLYFLK